MHPRGGPVVTLSDVVLRDVIVSACGRLCLHRKRINISTVLADRNLGIKEVDEGIRLVSFMHDDLGYFDREQKTLQPTRQPIRHEVVTYVLGTLRYPCVRAPQEDSSSRDRRVFGRWGEFVTIKAARIIPKLSRNSLGTFAAGNCRLFYNVVPHASRALSAAYGGRQNEA